MFILILTLMVPTASGLIDCEEACKNCRDQSEDPAIVEVYCSMCAECRDRREAVQRPDQRGEDRRGYDHRNVEERRREDQRREVHSRENPRREDPRRENPRREDPRREDPRREDQRREDHRREDHIDYMPDRVKYEQYIPSIPVTQSTFNIYRNILNQFATARAFESFDQPIPRKRSHTSLTRSYRNRESDVESDTDFLQAPKKRHLRYEEEYPDECPTPPECSDDEGWDLHTEATRPVTMTVKSTTTTPTTTTTKRTCPPIRHCKPKRHGHGGKNRDMSTPMYVPVPVPMFMGTCPPCTAPSYPYPMMTPSPGNNVANVPGGNNIPIGNNIPPGSSGPIEPAATHDQHGVVTPNLAPALQTQHASTSDYFYMYVGVPKNVIAKI